MFIHVCIYIIDNFSVNCKFAVKYFYNVFVQILQNVVFKTFDFKFFLFYVYMFF